ncbi:MAG TPA: lipoate--protein ligase family protein [Firmicutes bacterium]|nr:lipoate--protein ligase family protein [Bacillota bacterium]
MKNKLRIFFDEIPSSPFRNMSVDESLLINYIRNERPEPLLRLYKWKPASISIGYFQKAAEINLQKCEEEKIGFIRRPTGGRSVLHDEEITYAFIGGFEDIFQGQNLIQIYSIISKALVTGLRKSGFEVEFKKPDQTSSNYQTKVLCFDAVTSYEITLNDKKVVGSAQVRKKNAFLQHGSIILHLNKKKVAKLLEIKNIAILNNATGLLDESGDKFNEDAFNVNMSEAFSEIINLDPTESRFTEDERNLAEFLEENKYRTNAWNINGKELINEKVRI